MGIYWSILLLSCYFIFQGLDILTSVDEHKHIYVTNGQPIGTGVCG